MKTEQQFLDLIKNKIKLTPSEFRSFNRYYLHPTDRRLCSDCLNIFDEYKLHFHVKRYHYQQNGKTSSYENKCKGCRSIYNLEWRTNLKKDHVKYIKHSMVGIKSRAMATNVPYDIDSDFLCWQLEKQSNLCYYSGEPLDFTLAIEKRNSPHRNFPSVDRLIPELGYVRGNVVWSLYKINRMKNDLKFEEFITFCKDIANRF